MRIYSDTPNYEDARRTVMHEVKRYFRPEFLNRLDEVIVFHYLTEDNVREIIGKMVDKFLSDMADTDIMVDIDAAVPDKIAHDGFLPM